MAKIASIKRSIQELQPITGSPINALIFKLHHKIKSMNKNPFRFKWQDSSFYGRAVDYYGSISDVFIERDYDFIIPILEKLIENACILDAGANIGAFAIFCLSLREDMKIFSIEPGSSTYNLLERNACGFDNWSTHQVALWNEEAIVPFYYDETCSAGSHIDSNDNTDYEVQAMRLKTFIDTHVQDAIDILKMDIEGVEELVLEDAEDVLAEIPYFILETHPNCMDEKHVLELVHKHYPHVEIIKSNEIGQKVLFCSKGMD